MIATRTGAQQAGVPWKTNATIAMPSDSRHRPKPEDLGADDGIEMKSAVGITGLPWAALDSRVRPRRPPGPVWPRCARRCPQPRELRVRWRAGGRSCDLGP